MVAGDLAMVAALSEAAFRELCSSTHEEAVLMEKPYLFGVERTGGVTWVLNVEQMSAISAAHGGKHALLHVDTVWTTVTRWTRWTWGNWRTSICGRRWAPEPERGRRRPLQLATEARGTGGSLPHSGGRRNAGSYSAFAYRRPGATAGLMRLGRVHRHY